MRLAILIADLLHGLVVLVCGCPLVALLVYLLVPGTQAAWVMGLSLVPLASVGAAVVVLDLHLVESHPWLLKWKFLWSSLLLLLPPVVGPLLWVGWGRGWVKQGMVKEQGAPSVPPAPPPAAAPRPRPIPLPVMTTFEVLAPDSQPRHPTILLPDFDTDEKTLQVLPQIRRVQETFYEEHL